MLKQKSILFIDTGITGYGGSFRSLFYTVNSIKNQFKHIYVVYLNASEIIEQLNGENITLIKIDDPVYCKNRKIHIRIVLKLKRLIEKIFPWFKPLLEFSVHRNTLKTIEREISFADVDIIHFNIDPFRDLFGYKLCLKYNIPAIFHLRVFHLEGNTKSKVKLVNNVKNNSIAISESIRTSWIDQGLDRNQITVIPNFIRKGSITNEYKITTENNKVIKILFLGRIEKDKGLLFLLDAFKLLPEIFELYIVGDGGYMDVISQRIKELKLVKSVHLEGYKKNTEEYLKNSDILIVPSEKEPFGRVVLEGMLNKIPVIASRVGGIVDIIEDDIDGYFVEYNDVEALSDKIKFVANDGKSRKLIIESAYKKVTTIYSEAHYIDALMEIYKGII